MHVRRALLDSLKGAEPGTDFTRVFAQHGINKLHFAFDTKYFNYINPVSIAPQDCLHLFPDGLLRSECAWLFYILGKLGLDYDRVNAAIRRHPNWPADVRVPPIHGKLKQGAKGGKPKSSHTLKMTGSQVYQFAMHR